MCDDEPGTEPDSEERQVTGREAGNAAESSVDLEWEFQPARFPAGLGLPKADVGLLKEAAAAVRQEFRSSAKWKRLFCQKVSVFAERGRGTVFVLHVNTGFAFDWTWEGAVAFRPAALDGDYAITDEVAENLLYGDENTWRGEVVEVDVQSGCLYVALDNPETMPGVGDFFVRPFEFMATLDAVYNAPSFQEARRTLPQRLKATEGGIHPAIETSPPADAVFANLTDWWRRSWCVLWGPPGTGKSWTTGRQIAAALADPSERILVISTTNKATDTVALHVGNAIREHAGGLLEEGSLLRVGKGADLTSFQKGRLESMLQGTESRVLVEIHAVLERLRQARDPEEKAFARKQLAELRSIGDRSRYWFIDPRIRVIASTAFKATSQLQSQEVATMIANGDAPFTTIFIDEAGLMSRAAIAALSFLAARRVVLIGDSKQLAPISRVSRVLPMRQQRWLARSGLDHLNELEDTPPAVHVLREQRRMHPDVCAVVSQYQYRGALTTAPETRKRQSTAPTLMTDFSRAVWYVLDEETDRLADLRAERGPGNRSYVRGLALDILAKLFSDDHFRASKGIFVSPFRAQALLAAEWLAAQSLSGWAASTVHSQQGGEEDIIVFDTVHASNAAWPIEEWQRLINVGLSRATEAVILLASRAEMDEPYLRGLKRLLRPGVLKQEGHRLSWVSVAAEQATTDDRLPGSVNEIGARYAINSMGRQIAERKSMSPVFSREQQRLTNLKLDGRPRLVRGVAGSGKSVVMCAWIAKTIEKLDADPDAIIWAVYANRSLYKLLRDSIEAAWSGMDSGALFENREFPWQKVALLHIREVLEGVLPVASMSANDYEFDYERAAAEFLNRLTDESELPRCTALFVDEAQDMGHATLKLLLAMVAQTDDKNPQSRPAHIFYDNAQNVYGRKTPVWSDFGLDMRGRSTILKQSFRSTQAITELSINVLQRLVEEGRRDDLKELCDLDLVHVVNRDGESWLDVRFSEVEGPTPMLRQFDSRVDEMHCIARHLGNLFEAEQVLPTDTTLLYVGDKTAKLLETELAPQLKGMGVELSLQTKQVFVRRENTLLATTPHSFKGYESEAVIIPCVDQFVAGSGQILASPLYVAMTRARSLLAMYGLEHGSSASVKILKTLRRCLELLNHR